ncbi:hypothetical protein [Brachybacterium sp. UNK5269]|uniref:hypothetical protein n=1 Tax=Brachybacterium sp. UNK5269 TaxID=3408576 RepID=UPI003BB12561
MAPDVEDELFGDSARVVRATSTVVMRALEQMHRRQEERSRRAAEGYREGAQALADRESAQREAMRALIAPARDPQWVEKASDRDVAIAYVYAEAYAEQDEHARHTRDSLGRQLEARHGDVAAFVDAHVSADEIELTPVPQGADLSPSQARLVAARDETAQKWANILQVSGEDRASQWLEANLDEAEKARLAAYRHEDRADRERGEADTDRARAGAADGHEQERLHTDADEHEDAAAAAEADRESALFGRGEHPHDPDLAETRRVVDAEQREATEAATVAQGGRNEPLREQLANQRNRQRSGRHVKAKRQQSSEHINERGR